MDDFKQWLSRNEAHFKGYSVDEVATLAVACGFDRQMVAQWLTSQHFRAAA